MPSRFVFPYFEIFRSMNLSPFVIFKYQTNLIFITTVMTFITVTLTCIHILVFSCFYRFPFFSFAHYQIICSMLRFSRNEIFIAFDYREIGGKFIQIILQFKIHFVLFLIKHESRKRESCLFV